MSSKFTVLGCLLIFFGPGTASTGWTQVGPFRPASTTATLRVHVPEAGTVLINGKRPHPQPISGGWRIFTLTGLVPSARYAKVANIEIELPDGNILQPPLVWHVRAGKTYAANITSSYSAQATNSGGMAAESIESMEPIFELPAPAMETSDSVDGGSTPASDADATDEFLTTAAAVEVKCRIALTDPSRELTARLSYSASGLALNRLQFDAQYLPDTVVLLDETEWNLPVAFLKDEASLTLELLVKLEGEEFKPFPVKIDNTQQITLTPQNQQRLATLKFKREFQGTTVVSNLQGWIEASVEKNTDVTGPVEKLFLSSAVTYLGIAGTLTVGDVAVRLEPPLEIRIVK